MQRGTHLSPVPLSFRALPPSSPPSWGGAGEHSWAPAPTLWALIPYSCGPYSLIPSLLSPLPPPFCLTALVASYPSWSCHTLNTFFTSNSQVTHVKQANYVTLHSAKDTVIVVVAHSNAHTHKYIYTNKTMHCRHLIICCLGLPESLVDTKCQIHTQAHSCKCIQKIPLWLCPEASFLRLGCEA